MVLRSAVPLVMMMVRVPQVVLGVDPSGRVGGPWASLGVGCCYSWLGATWVALLAVLPASLASAFGDRDGEDAVGDILCWGRW